MDDKKRPTQNKMIIKKCTRCGQLNEAIQELKRCAKCSKPFLPANYFSKVHAKNTQEFHNLYCDSDELHEEDMIKGLTVLW